MQIYIGTVDMSHPGRNCRTRSGGTQLRQVTSSIHPGQPCQPCILCNQGNHSKYFHPKTWKDDTLVARLKQYVEPDIDIKPDSCICRSCRDDVNKIDNPSFTPRWRKSKTTCNASCVCLYRM